MDKAELNRAYFEAGDWLHTKYKGIPIFKYATDLYRYEDILRETNPDLIIECGTLKGGSALWLKDHSNAKVITIDVDHVNRQHDGIQYVTGNSLQKRISTKGYRRVMVILDSDHCKEHVLAELKKFSPLVSKGCYLVVEDTFISRYLNNQDPNNDYSGGSSWEAIQDWDNTGFEQEEGPFMLSMNPGGWFQRV